MDLNITKQEKQPLLSRTEIIAEITFEGKTPSRYDLVKIISKKLKIKPELTLVKHIYTEFGSQKANVEVYTYEDAKVMGVLEKKIREVKEPKKVESPTSSETPKEAAPTEEVKEGKTLVESSKEASVPAEESKPVEKKQETPADKED